MTFLLLAALLWLFVHIGIAGTGLRATVVDQLGERGFRAAFSALSVATILFLVWAFRAAPAIPLWTAPDWLRWLLLGAMLPAFLLFVGSVTTPNPTAIQPAPAAGTAPGASHGTARMPAPRGIVRVTRHPMLCGFALWALVHMIGTGELAALVFFGSFLVTAVAGMPSIDAKLASRDPNGWQALAAATSLIPFAAILEGRNQLVLREIGWITVLIAVVAWIGLLGLHQWLFGVSPIWM